MAELVGEAATAISIGQRERQEDAVAAEFCRGAEVGLAVLSDGMGGHDAGDVASRIIVAEMFGELFFSGANPRGLHESGPDILRGAVSNANESLRHLSEAGAGQDGMGGTVVSALVYDDQLRWISVGDSPLYLFRRGRLRRLNEDHSMGPAIDHLVSEGLMDEETARTHPQRNCLTSALTGGNVDKIDCPAEPLALRAGDVVVAASDGLQVLDDRRIRRILSRNRFRDCRRTADALIRAVEDFGDPEQDNTSVVVIKMSQSDTLAQPGVRQAMATALAALSWRAIEPVYNALGFPWRRFAG